MHIYMKACEQCGGEVPLSTKVGDSCPHCGVRFGGERTRVTGAGSRSSSSTPGSSSDSDDALAGCLGVIAIALLIAGGIFGFRWISGAGQEKPTPVRQEQTIQKQGAHA